AQLKAAEDAYLAARRKFERVGQQLLERRLKVLDAADKAYRKAYDNGLADRKALREARTKREEAAVAAQELAAIYDEVIWRSTDSVAVRLSDAEVHTKMVKGTTMDRITTMPEWVRRTTGKDPRDTQWRAWILHVANVNTGEGKTLISSMAIV